MARRIQPIFDAILADARIQGRERIFVESLQTHYHRRKSLSPGRRRCLLQIEERLNAPPATIEKELETQLSTTEFRARIAGDAWAVDFIGSLRGQLLAGRELSPRQKEILAKVEARHSDEAQAVRDNWASSFTSEMREKMIIAAHYYLANPPYFGDLARKAIEDDTFVPSQKAYAKMVENKYTTKVIESTLSEAKFAAGSHVALRANAKIRRAVNAADVYPISEMQAKTGVVIKSNAAPVISPARGSKVYSVLFFGEVLPVFVEERWLKKARKR
tara:strand:+ start:3965 stop:4786 length:822 start_codon:yes stop_codon:yes gene_type:complete